MIADYASLEAIKAERRRQESIGYTPTHDDDEHDDGSLVAIAYTYLSVGTEPSMENLVKATAVLTAEIDRRLRAPRRRLMASDMDFGNGIVGRVLHSEGKRIGMILDHPGADGMGECSASFRWSGEGRLHTIVKAEPLELSPSLGCRICGLHGWIRDGRWVATSPLSGVGRKEPRRDRPHQPKSTQEEADATAS